MKTHNKKIKPTVKSVTVFAVAKAAPLLPAAYFGVRISSFLKVLSSV
jgi:hypothetical protein